MEPHNANYKGTGKNFHVQRRNLPTHSSVSKNFATRQTTTQT